MIPEKRHTVGGVSVGPRAPDDGQSYDFRQLPKVEVEPVADTNDRRTPRWFFEQCRNRYGLFELDAAACAQNALCGFWFGPGSPHGEDALSEVWGYRLTWLNPPYGPGGTIEKWIAKAREQRDKFETRTLMLLPADTSTRWFHDVSRTELVELVPFRLKFDGPEGVQNNSAKFGSVLVWIAPKIQRPTRSPTSDRDTAP